MAALVSAAAAAAAGVGGMNPLGRRDSESSAMESPVVVIRRILVEEFQLRKMSLMAKNMHLFVRSQWPLPPAVFLLYRACMCLYALSYPLYAYTIEPYSPNVNITVGQQQSVMKGHFRLAYQTQWSFLVLCVYFGLSFATTLWCLLIDDRLQRRMNRGRRVWLFRTQSYPVADEEPRVCYLKENGAVPMSTERLDSTEENECSRSHVQTTQLGPTNPSECEAGEVHTETDQTPDSPLLQLPAAEFPQPSDQQHHTEVDDEIVEVPAYPSNSSSDWLLSGMSSLSGKIFRVLQILQWCALNIAFNCGLQVSVVYFAFYHTISGVALNYENLNSHLINSLMILLEMVVCATPLHLLHVVYPVSYAIIYVIFSLVFWGFDRTNIIYPVALDWNRPGTAVMASLCVFLILTPCSQIILFCFYRVRIWIYCRIFLVVNKKRTTAVQTV